MLTGIAGGEDLGPYRVESLQRSGAGGAVYRADEPGLQRRVALVVPSNPSGSDSSARFLEDARLIARLSHPNLLPVYEVSEADGGPFAVVRDPQGRRLDELLQDGALPADRAVEICAQVAAALEAIRAAGAEPAALTPSSVIIVGDDDREHVYLSPLEAIIDAPAGTNVLRRATADSDRSVAELAVLLRTMEGGDHPDEAVIERGLEPGGYDSPGAFIAAARTAAAPIEVVRRRSRRTIALLLGAVAVLVLVAAAAILVIRGDGDEPEATPAASPNAPAGRVAATIPLGADPGSVAVGSDALWVATADGTVLRVDPRRKEVVGAPVRFMDAREGENVTIRAGEGAVWVLDGSGGTLTRIDPETARVTGRLRIGGILHGAEVGAGSVWISRAPPGKGPRQAGELVRVDADSFQRIGRPIPIGPLALDVELGDGFVWTMNAGDGTMTRYDLETGVTRTVRASAQPIGAALKDGTVWIADPIDRTVTPLDARGSELPDDVVRSVDHPFSAAATDDAVWVVAEGDSSTARLYRIDPRSRSIVGRPVELGRSVGWATTGFGAVWIYSHGKRALLKVVPTSPPPSPQRQPTGQHDPRVVAAGPLVPGNWRASRFVVPFRFAVGERGWIASPGPQLDLVEFWRFDSPHTKLSVSTPRQVFTPKGSVQPLREASRVVEVLSSNPNLRIVSRERVNVGGVPAQRVTVSVRQHEQFPDFCTSPCVPVFPVTQATSVLESNSNHRLSIMEVGGRIIVVHETSPRGGNGFPDTESLLHGLRFEKQSG